MGAMAAVIAATWVGCSSTQMDSTWQDPTAQGAPLHKVAVVCLTRDEGLRRMAEDEAVNQIGGGAVASYRALGDVPLNDREAVKERLRRQGFDGVLVMRLAGVSEQVNGMAPVATFDGYYPYAYGLAYAPTVDTVVHMVTNLYSLPDNKLIWSGVSKTFDPASASSTVDDVSKAVGKELKKNHLLI